MSNTKLFYTYRDSSDGKEKLLKALSAYSDSLIFDEDNRRIWHRGHQYGNSYWGSYHGETFNDFKSNTASGDYSHAEGSFATASGFCSHAEGEITTASAEAAHAEGLDTQADGEAAHAEGKGTRAYQDYSHAEGNETIANGLSSHAEGISTKANGNGSHAEGYETITYGSSSHTEGSNTITYGSSSHTEGSNTITYGRAAHAEGESTIASAEAAHAEGLGTKANGEATHAEGIGTIASQDYSHAEGNETIANGLGSHAEGISTKANGLGSHAEGYKTIVNGDYSHAEGSTTVTYGNYSHAEGLHTTAEGECSHTEGYYTKANFTGAHAEGSNTVANEQSSHAEGEYTVAWTMASHAEGYSTKAGEFAAHAEGLYTNAEGIGSHSEGAYTYTYGEYSHAGGIKTIARGKASHAEGNMTYAYGDYSHAEGDNTFTYKNYSHAEGTYTSALGKASHAEGDSCTAEGIGSHAEGFATLSQGDYSHTQGLRTFAFNSYEVAFGEFNKSLNGEDISYKTVFSIGDGIDDSNRHNIIDFRKNGDMHKNGNSYFHDNIYGPVSYTYVESLGESATLDIVLSSLLTQPEYTRPNITVKYSHSGNIEIGTYITPTITLEWPERREHTNGTRAYTLENGPTMPNYLLGYSYGIKRIFLKYNNGINEDNTYSDIVNDFYDYEYNGEGLNNYGLGKPLPLNQSPVYILDENEYVLSNKIIITYLPSSYMYFQQLYDKNVYVYAYGLPPKEWTNGGTLTIGTDNIVYGKLKYYYGFSGDIIDLNGGNVPTVREIKHSTFGWLSKSSETTKISITTPALNDNASKYCFWIAYPDTDDDINNAITNKHYKLVANSDKFKIEVLMKDGMNFDLVSPDQPLKSTYIDLPIGNIKIPSATSPFGKDLTIRYKIAYIDFQKPIGNVNNILKFTIAPKNNAMEAII